MATYVMSDLHGHYDAYKRMLSEIDFKNTDMLYILGDILDRGPNPIKIILDLMQRPNVEVIAGNHCLMACSCFSFLMQEITEESLDKIDDNIIAKLLDWQQNGGNSTIEEFRKYDKYTQREIIEYISDFELYDTIEVGGRSYILVHAGLGNFSPDKELWDYDLDELVWYRPNYDEPYFSDKFVVTGHTPTMLIEGNPKPSYIYQANNHIAIDCGCSFPGGRLGCLRLDDMKEFYVEA